MSYLPVNIVGSYPLTFTLTASTNVTLPTTGTLATTTGPTAAGALTGTTLAANVVTSSLTSVGTLTSLAITTGEAVLAIGGVNRGALAQVSGLSAGFNIFTPTANLNYHLVISGKDASDGNTPSNAFIDVVDLNGAAGFTPVASVSANTLGTPGARTYSNATGALKIVVASGTTWYVDVAVTRFAS